MPAPGRIWVFCRRVLTAFALLFLMVTFTPVTRWWAAALATPWFDPDAEVLVVLGGSDLVDALGESSYLRAVYTVRAMRQVRYRKVVICGAGSAPKIRDFLVGHGVPTGNVLLDETSLSTRENALQTLALLPGIAGKQNSSIVLLTSDYHIFRAAKVFRKAGVSVRPHPVPDALKRYNFPSRRWSAFLDLCEELAKSCYYSYKGWM